MLYAVDLIRTHNQQAIILIRWNGMLIGVQFFLTVFGHFYENFRFRRKKLKEKKYRILCLFQYMISKS